MELLNPISTSRALNLFYARELYRVGIALVPTADPRIFETPGYFIHDPSAITIEVFHNGRGLYHSSTQSPKDGDFYVEESVPGAGYDQVVLVTFTPDSRSTLRANYFAST
jgi:hypothetical protein